MAVAQLVYKTPQQKREKKNEYVGEQNHSKFYNFLLTGPGSSVGCASAWHADDRGLILGSGNILSWRLVMKSFISTAILSLPLIKVGQLSQLLAKGCARSTG